MLLPTGTIVNIAVNPIKDYLLCDGQAVSRIEYAQLFDLIFTLFGNGDGSTTFNVPNLNKLFIRGANSDNIGAIKKQNYIKHGHKVNLLYGGAHSHLLYWVGATSMEDGGGRPLDYPQWHEFITMRTSFDGAHRHTVTFEEAGENIAQPECVNMMFGITI